MRAPRRFLFALTMLAASTQAMGTATAQPLVREHYSGTESFDFDDCGFDIHVENTFSGVFMLKTGRGGDPTPYWFDNYKYSSVVSNPNNGKWFTQSGNGLYKDLHITLVSGTIYRFVAMESGRPFQIRDMDGRLVLNDRGLLRYAFMVDTLGDSDPDNDIFIDGSFELLADNGAHPGFYADFCDVAADLLL